MQLIGRIDVLFTVTPELGFEWFCYCTYVLLMVRTNVSYFAQLFYPVVRRVSECFGAMASHHFLIGSYNF